LHHLSFGSSAVVLEQADDAVVVEEDVVNADEKKAAEAEAKEEGRWAENLRFISCTHVNVTTNDDSRSIYSVSEGQKHCVAMKEQQTTT
jgi:hypothetical protein